MSGRINTLPFFPRPPAAYDARYFGSLITSFSTYVQQANTPGEGRHVSLVLTEMDSDDFGVEPGTLFHVDGAVRVCLTNMPYARGTGMTCSGGIVTITP